MKQGDIVWLKFPFSNLTQQKLRPAVVLSNDRYNKYANVLLAGIYGKKQPLSMQITNRDLEQKKMQKTSYISFQNIMSVEKTLIGQRIDSLNAQKLQQVLRALQNYC